MRFALDPSALEEDLCDALVSVACTEAGILTVSMHAAVPGMTLADLKQATRLALDSPRLSSALAGTSPTLSAPPPVYDDIMAWEASFAERGLHHHTFLDVHEVTLDVHGDSGDNADSGDSAQGEVVGDDEDTGAGMPLESESEKWRRVAESVRLRETVTGTGGLTSLGSEGEGNEVLTGETVVAGRQLKEWAKGGLATYRSQAPVEDFPVQGSLKVRCCSTYQYYQLAVTQRMKHTVITTVVQLYVCQGWSLARHLSSLGT